MTLFMISGSLHSVWDCVVASKRFNTQSISQTFDVNLDAVHSPISSQCRVTPDSHESRMPNTHLASQSDGRDMGGGSARRGVTVPTDVAAGAVRFASLDSQRMVRTRLSFPLIRYSLSLVPSFCSESLTHSALERIFYLEFCV
ncbi:hypothetical protein E2C01_054889 [Portunus trituberculatus]|uniref:Uncharacterized protein n=1 Tax=Portunus trituberculatus TaxID=210409 RepID=A0A5B7GL06_PORTR|nr:hypothetical protein [Portunus trituberculatus]